jgi:DNA-binding HxlR family transcriptional regulator
MQPIQPDCAISYAIDIIGGKWKLAILYYLMHGTKRFNELRRLMPEVTQQMLTLQLRELERDGVVHREVYAQVPPKVEYSLTEHGRTLESILLALGEWGEEHRHQQTDVSVPSQGDHAPAADTTVLES